MSKTRTITDRAIAHPLVEKVIQEQIGNLIGRRCTTRGAYKQVHFMLTKVARRAVQCALQGHVSKPDMTHDEWKSTFANDVERAMIASGFERDADAYIAWFQGRMPKVIGDRAQTKWIYYKLATYAGQCATMLIHKLDPNMLIMSSEEGVEEQLELLEMVVEAGIPAVVVEFSE